MYSTLNILGRRLLPEWIYDWLIARFDVSGLKRYGSNALWALMARIVNIVVSFAVTIYLVRYLGPTNYGQLSYAVSFVGLFSIIAGLGLDDVLYRDLIKYPDRRREYLGTAFVLKLSAGTLAGILTVFSAIIFSHDDVSRLVIFLLAGTFIFNAFNVITYEFQANVAQKYISLTGLLVVFILNLLKLLVILVGEGILYIGVILLLEAILYAVFFSLVRLRHYGSLLTWRFDRSVAISLLRDSWPFIFITAFTAIYIRIDQVLLKHMLGSEAVGLYDAAVRLADAWLFIPAVIMASLFPAIVNAKQVSAGEYQRRLKILLLAIGLMGVLIALPLSLLAKPLIGLLYGAAFAASVGVFSIYVWAGVWASLAMVTNYFLIAENRRFLIFAITCGTALLNIVLNLLFIPEFGIQGAAWSTLISYALLALPIFLIFRLK